MRLNDALAQACEKYGYEYAVEHGVVRLFGMSRPWTPEVRVRMMAAIATRKKPDRKKKIHKPQSGNQQK